MTTEAQRAEIRRSIAEVHDNYSRMRACPRHRFEPPERVKLGQRFTCKACHGVMNLREIGMYVRGYRAAGGNPDDIWPGWRG